MYLQVKHTKIIGINFCAEIMTNLILTLNINYTSVYRVILLLLFNFFFFWKKMNRIIT